MIDGNSVLGVILARGGSKGLPRKNIRELAGKPLIAWTIEAGHRSEYLDQLILSSDDEEIMSVAEKYGCEVPFQRPDKLARDETPSMQSLLHAMDQMPKHDMVVLLQPTSPLRTAEDIDSTIALCHESNAPACVTVCEADKPPEWMCTIEKGNSMEPVVDREGVIKRRQDAPTTYVINGAVYVAWYKDLRNKESFFGEETVAKVMPKERSADIDTPLDLEWCSFMMSYK